MLNLAVTLGAQGQQLNASFATSDNIAWAFTGSINGTPINLTGSNIKMTIGFETPLELSTENGSIVITNAAAGQFVVNMPSDQTAEFDAGFYPYDLWIESQLSPPIETQYITGQIVVIQSISVFP